VGAVGILAGPQLSMIRQSWATQAQKVLVQALVAQAPDESASHKLVGSNVTPFDKMFLRPSQHLPVCRFPSGRINRGSAPHSGSWSSSRAPRTSDSGVSTRRTRRPWAKSSPTGGTHRRRPSDNTSPPKPRPIDSWDTAEPPSSPFIQLAHIHDHATLLKMSANRLYPPFFIKNHLN